MKIICPECNAKVKGPTNFCPFCNHQFDDLPKSYQEESKLEGWMERYGLCLYCGIPCISLIAFFIFMMVLSGG